MGIAEIAAISATTAADRPRGIMVVSIPVLARRRFLPIVIAGTTMNLTPNSTRDRRILGTITSGVVKGYHQSQVSKENCLHYEIYLRVERHHGIVDLGSPLSA